MIDELKLQLARRYPTLKIYQINKSVENYTNAVMQQIALQFVTVTNEDLLSGEIGFAKDVVSQQCGQVTVDGKMMRVFTMMQADPSTSLVLVMYKGNSLAKRISKITFNPRYKKGIYKALITEKYKLSSAFLDELDKEPNYSIRVDMETLESYIDATTQALTTSKGIAYDEKLLRNLSAAKAIQQHAVLHVDGSYLNHEVWSMIDSGRMHGNGLSLQSVAKEVRHAALGRCAKIDFRASSYAILTSYALTINPDLKVASLASYVRNRISVRKRIAKAIGVSEDWMKTIFTSLGFGAEVKDNPFNSIRKMLGKEKFDLLVANREFVNIKSDLDVVRKTILNLPLIKSNLFQIGDHKYNEINPKTETKRNANQKLAWIYQAFERTALDIVINNIPVQCNILLPVHDCLYITPALSLDDSDRLNYLLQKEFSLLSFSQERIFPIHAEGIRSKRDLEIDAEEAAHKQRIAKAELDAIGYKSVVFDDDEKERKEIAYKTETNEQYERRRRMQFLVDIQRHEQEMKQRDEDTGDYSWR